MNLDINVLRLFVSQAFAVYFLLTVIPLKEPQNKNTMTIIVGAVVITLANALLINFVSMMFYVRFYVLTLTIPYIILFSYFSLHKGAKFIFALLSVQVIGNVSILNGLLAAYLYYGDNHPLIDTLARVITYIIFLPLLYKYLRPTYLKMAETLNNGWWVLNAALVLTYALAYYILFIPDAIFHRPTYFIHAYLAMILSLLIYVIIFLLFSEIQLKMTVQQDKVHLSTRVRSLTAESAAITTIAYKDALTGVHNRYALFQNMYQRIEKKQPFLVVFTDLDDLKTINDNYDHSEGDLYLKQYAFALQNTIGDQGIVYRIAGDEFICLITHDFSQFDVEHFRTTVAKEILIDMPFLGMSIGTSRFPDDAQNPDDLIRIADKAMYVEKKAKKTNA